MGNISYLVPSIHPMIKVAADGVAIHTVDFAEWASSADGDQAVLDGAKAMAMTVVDLWTSADLRRTTAAAFAESTSSGRGVCKRRSGRRAIRPSGGANP